MIKRLVLRLVVGAILASGAAVAAEAPSSRTTTEMYRDWTRVCLEQNSTSQCEIKQNLLNANSQLVSVISVASPDGADGPVMQFALPHMLDLTVPLTVTVDGEKKVQLPFNFCNQAACFALADGDSELFEYFKDGNRGEVNSRAINGEELRLDFSLRGFSSALAALVR